LEISSDSSSLKIGETALITFNLGEASADFGFADVSVAGGTLSNFASVTSGNGLVYTAVFTPSANSSATAFIKVDAGKFADSFGNQNQPSNVLKIAVDTSAPVANFAKIATPRNTAVNSLELGFTELVQGLDVSDLSLTFNGNLVSLAGVGISGSGSNYTISGLNTSAQGSYLFSLNSAGSGISDLAGNSLVANAQVSWIVDTSSPAVAITSSTSNLNPVQTAVITFNFSTAPTGFDVSDISAVGGNITGLTKSSNTVYTATFTPAVNFSGKGSVSVSNGYTNAAGTTGLPGLSEPISIDTLAPTSLISADSQKLAAGQTSTITITFSETVTGFDSTDLAVEGGTIGALVQSRANPLVYTTVFAPNSNFTGKGKILLQGSYEDVSGNSGTVASLLPELLVDTMPARVDFITRGKPSSPDTNASAVAFNVRFNEIVAGVDASDFELVLSNGLTVASPLFVAGKGDSYSVDVSGISKTDGVLGIRLKNDATILDAFGNALVNTTTLNENQAYTIDNTAPAVVSINSDKYRLGSTTKANITITFSEAPKGFDAFDVGATGGTLSILAATSDPRVYTATFTPTAGTTTSNARVTVYQGYSDVAGNPGSEFVMATPMAIVGVPVGKIVPLNPPAEVAPEGSIVLRVNFTEDVNELEVADFTTTGVVTLSNLQRVTGGNKSFTVLATAGASEGDFSVGLRANATEDIGLPENKTALVSPITIRVDASSGFDSAKVVEANQGSKTTFGGFADIANDADFFKFTAAFTGSVSTLVKADASKFDPFATAYVQEGSNYKLLISDDNSGGGTSSKMDFNVTAGKTYFIKVESPAKTTGKYSLEITGGEKLADDFGDSQADASVLSVSSRPVTTNGTLENNQDSDSFKFTPTQNGKVDISFAATTLTSGKLNIFSTTSTTPLASLDFNGSNSFDVLAGKTYHLLVSSEAGGTGDYSFTISSQAALQFVNGVAKATNFIPVAGNADVYSLSAPSSGLLSILVENRDRTLGLLSQPSFAVYNSNGNLLTANVFSTLGPIGASKQIVNLNATVGETYFVKVGEVGTFTGNYNITVQSDDVASLARTSNGMPMYSSVPLPAGGTTGKIELAGDTDLYSYSYSNSTGNLSKLQILMSPASGSALVSGMFVSQDNGISWNAASQKGSLVELDVEAGETKSLLIWASGSSG
ncbi:MAG: Ig-like domain-containing protein, partial [Planctomycetia bacterium]